MQLILKRLAAKIKQDDIDHQSSGPPCIKHMFDSDFDDEIVRRLPEDDVYDDVYRFIGHPDAMLPDGGGLTEKITKWQKPKDRLLWSDMRDADHKQITATDIPKVLDEFGDSLKVLSLDCFDTLLWRKTATPGDVFAVLADNPVARRLG
ncbi:hypothetical protein, partial [Mesorhizobium sp. M1272]|uniref:hypothetical protein n=1 Tax=Mesorhizobium sp. M1272 TaxID=2957074 RepID=UPI00333DB2BF